MRLFKLLVFIIFILSTVACATITRGNRQNVTIRSTPEDAKVVVKSNNDYYEAKTPSTFNLLRKKSYDVIISKEGYRNTYLEIKPQADAIILGNIIWGGIGGILIDAISGSGLSLEPGFISVSLKPRHQIKSDEPCPIIEETVEDDLISTKDIPSKRHHDSRYRKPESITMETSASCNYLVDFKDNVNGNIISCTDNSDEVYNILCKSEEQRFTINLNKNNVLKVGKIMFVFNSTINDYTELQTSSEGIGTLIVDFNQETAFLILSKNNEVVVVHDIISNEEKKLPISYFNERITIDKNNSILFNSELASYIKYKLGYN